MCYNKLHGNSKPKHYDESIVATHTIQGKENEKACPRCNGMVLIAVGQGFSLSNSYFAGLHKQYVFTNAEKF